MAYSLEGMNLAQSLVINELAAYLDMMKPGTSRSLFDGLARKLSDSLEKDPNPHGKDALYIIGEWAAHQATLEALHQEKATPEGRAEDDAEDETLSPGVASQQWLVDPEYAPATMEGQAAARLALNMVVQLIRHLDLMKPTHGIKWKVFNATDEGMVLKRQTRSAQALDDEIRHLFLQYKNALDTI